MEKQTKFIIISTAYNKGKWISYNIHSIRQQTYQNYIAVYGYDKSDDDTLQHIEDNFNLIKDPRFQVYHNPNPGSFLKCFTNTYSYLKSNNLVDPEDVIVEIDGDDWLLHSFVLQHLADIYSDSGIWMTYGQYITYPHAEYGSHMYLQLEDVVDKYNSYRSATFPYSHLKSYKAHLLDRVDESDLVDPTTSEYFAAAGDFALCMPMVEMAGKSRIFRVEQPMYVYNVGIETSETNASLHLQKEAEAKIRQLKPRNRL